jgi:4,5-dihydroxyphthalate decarboxylase
MSLTLQTALVSYGHTKSLIDGSLRSDKVEIDHTEVSPITTAFRRMVRTLDYDVSEMALSTYLCARDHGVPITGLPIFVLRRFEHGQIVYNVNSGIQGPGDLAGRKVGVRGYTVTPGVWMRGILSSGYGVDLDQVTWVLSGDEHVAEYVAPPNVVPAAPGSDLGAMLLSGEIDAAIGPGNVDSPDIQPLIPNPFDTGAAFYKETGIYPISHHVVVKNEVLEANPWLPEELFGLFKSAKDQYLAGLASDGPQNSQDESMSRMQQVIGPDPLLYGVTPNRKTLESFIQFNVEQKVISRSVDLEELFPRSVMDLE